MAPSRPQPHPPNIDPRWAPPSAAEMLMRSRPDLYPYVPAGWSREGSSASIESRSAFDSALGQGDAGSFPGAFGSSDRNPIGGDWHNRDLVSAPLGLLPQGFEADSPRARLAEILVRQADALPAPPSAPQEPRRPWPWERLARSFLQAQENFLSGRSAEGKPFSEMPLFAAPWEDSRFTELGKFLSTGLMGGGPGTVTSGIRVPTVYVPGRPLTYAEQLRRSNWNHLQHKLGEIDRGNPQWRSFEGPDFLPSQPDLDAASGAIGDVIKRDRLWSLEKHHREPTQLSPRFDAAGISDAMRDRSSYYLWQGEHRGAGGLHSGGYNGRWRGFFDRFGGRVITQRDIEEETLNILREFDQLWLP
jgi:hypothetical protein